MSGLPRGWTRSREVASALVSLTMPAIAGVSHVLDSFSAKIVNESAVAVLFTILVSTSDAAYMNVPLGTLATPAPTGGVATDSINASGLGISTGPNVSLTVAFSTFVAGVDHFLIIQGYDV